jgi:hypothetical protein
MMAALWLLLLSAAGSGALLLPTAPWHHASPACAYARIGRAPLLCAPTRGRGRGGGRGGRGAGAPPVKVRYIPEAEMQESVRTRALEKGFEPGTAAMLGSCACNIYSMGCQYHPNTVTMLEELCKDTPDQPWAVLLLRCITGKLPRLRSADTASVRMQAAKKAAARRKANQQK